MATPDKPRPPPPPDPVTPAERQALIKLIARQDREIVRALAPV